MKIYRLKLKIVGNLKVGSESVGRLFIRLFCS